MGIEEINEIGFYAETRLLNFLAPLISWGQRGWCFSNPNT